MINQSKLQTQASLDAEVAGGSGPLDKNEFLIEDYFVQLLTLERKKSERSRKSFLLMRIKLQDRVYVQETSGLFGSLAAALMESTRETDVKGWYSYPYTIGVLFTDTELSAKPAILGKVSNSIRARLSPAETEKITITFHAFPDDHDNPKRELVDLKVYPDLEMKNAAQRKGLCIKRGIDLLGSLVGLLLFSPVFLFIAACIRLTSRGPVFFRQERVGQYGKRFEFLKFRSMWVDNDPAIHKEYVTSLIEAARVNNAKTEEQPRTFKIQNDPRVTPVGRFLRQTSLDELPQLINVLMGDMSLVGPRPPIPYEVEKYDIWHRRRIIEVKPGITGLWQVEGRSRTTFDNMVRLDLKYVQEWSVGMDLKILLQTLRAVFTTKGAY